MTINDLIRQAHEAAPEAEDEDLAEALLAKLTKRELLPLLVERVQNIRRNIVRGIEADAFKALVGDESRTAAVVATSERFDALFKAGFSLGDGFMRRWGEATVAEHHCRIAFLSGQVDGLNRTIQRHRDAIEVIEGAGVTCLNEIRDAA